jgi:hypothetical protein
MKKIIGLIMVMVALSFSLAYAMPDFSADYVMKSKGRAARNPAKVFYSGKKFRSEISERGMSMIIIGRMDKNVLWSLMPKTNTYMESKLQPEDQMSFTDKMSGEISRKKVGNEKVSGVMCDKYEVVYKFNNKNQKAFQWITTDNKISMKVMAADGAWESEMQNLKVGSQPASLFEVPAGYKKMAIPNIKF